MDGILQSLIDSDWVMDMLVSHPYAMGIWTICVFVGGIKLGWELKKYFGNRPSSPNPPGDGPTANIKKNRGNVVFGNTVTINDESKMHQVVAKDVRPLTSDDVSEIIDNL